MKKSNNLPVLAFIVFFFWTLVGCASVSPSSTPFSQLTPTLLSTSQNIVLSRTPNISNTIETTPVNIKPTPTALLAITPSPPPIGTLSASEAQAVILGFYGANTDCRLPCWWGFTPGQTTWEEVEQFLVSLGSEIHFYDLAENMGMAEVKIFVSDVGYLRQIYTVNNGVVEMIETVLSLRNPTYNLSAFLNDYGYPSEVWLSTYSYAIEGELPFDMLMFYPDHGVLMRYDVEAMEENNIVYGCPQNKPALVIEVWNPNKKLTFIEALETTVEIGTEKDYKLLEEATDMNVEIFFDTFVKPDTKTCIETPSEFWSSS